MILRWRFGNVRVTFTIARVVDVVGVNSLLPDGKHILMWDFDNVPFHKVVAALGMVQYAFHLPPIYILRTKEPDNYIAYCFKRCDWREAVGIIAQTSYVDLNFFKYGVYRGRFTLRVGAKCGRIPKLVMVLRSKVRENASIPELRSWVKYETLPDVIKIG